MSNEVVLNCLYTHQKLKKKKTFQDGTLKVFASCCVLYRSDTKISALGSLETRQLTKEERAGIVNGSLTEIEFDGYFVEIDCIANSMKGESESLESSSKKSKFEKFSVPKFKPPSKIQKVGEHKVLCTNNDGQQNRTNSCKTGVISGFANRSSRGKYDVAEEELDNIWSENVNERECRDFDSSIEDNREKYGSSEVGCTSTDRRMDIHTSRNSIQTVKVPSSRVLDLLENYKSGNNNSYEGKENEGFNSSRNEFNFGYHGDECEESDQGENEEGEVGQDEKYEEHNKLSNSFRISDNLSDSELETQENTFAISEPSLELGQTHSGSSTSCNKNIWGDSSDDEE